MITKAIISHYRSIGTVALDLKPINVFVGPNGSGKSNVLDAITFLHDCATEGIDAAVTKRHGIDSLRQWSRTRPYHIGIELHFQNSMGTGMYRVSLASIKGQYKILDEQGSWTGNDIDIFSESKNSQSEKTIMFHRNKNGIIIKINSLKDGIFDENYSIGDDDLLLTGLDRHIFKRNIFLLRHVYFELQHFSIYNIYPNSMRIPQSVSREKSLDDDGSNLASILKAINSDKRGGSAKDEIVSSLRTIMPSLIDFQVKSIANYYVPILRVKEENDDIHDFNLSQISDGTLRTLGLLCAFYQPAGPDKIGVEEPEQMIHPGALAVIYEGIKSFVSSDHPNQKQVFVTTHSPTFLDFFDPEDIIWTQMRGGATECGRVQPRQMDIIKRQLFTAGELLLAEGIFG